MDEPRCCCLTVAAVQAKQDHCCVGKWRTSMKDLLAGGGVLTCSPLLAPESMLCWRSNSLSSASSDELGEPSPKLRSPKSASPASLHRSRARPLAQGMSGDAVGEGEGLEAERECWRRSVRGTFCGAVSLGHKAG